jgi:L-asparaginase
MNKKKVLLIHTGGTLGMVKGNPSLQPSVINENVWKFVPELKELADLESAFIYNIDSANLNIENINKILACLEENYNKFDGFVVIHGTDTMAFSASAISFMIENNKKPIVFTGSQKPLRQIRTDARINLINSVEFATMDIPEVTICFNSMLYRANRAKKINVDHFGAFESPNYPPLAEVGVNIDLNKKYIEKANNKKTEFTYLKKSNLCVVKLFPGINIEPYLNIFKNHQPDAVIVEAYAAGNFPVLENSFIPFLKTMNENNVPVFVVSQCLIGGVDLSLYQCGQLAMEEGAVGCFDMTFEAAVSKLFYLLSKDKDSVKVKMKENIAGEISI